MESHLKYCAASTAHEYEQPGKEWIKNLIEYVRSVATKKPRVKIFGQLDIFHSISANANTRLNTGICFGHQIVALAMGGTCVRNARFEVSATKLQLTELGKRVYGIDSGVLVRISHLPMSSYSYFRSEEHSFDEP
jgi:hypothetical protein